MQSAENKSKQLPENTVKEYTGVVTNSIEDITEQLKTVAKNEAVISMFEQGDAELLAKQADSNSGKIKIV